MSVLTHAAIEAVWRIESPRLLGGLMRFTRDLDAAEDLAQEALVAALERWPETGVPDNPGAWLMTTAKNRALDGVRRAKMVANKHVQLGHELSTAAAPDVAPEVGDDVLRLVFVACHPILPREARAALTLRLLGGLSTGEIARAFLVPETTMAQRIVRAKRTLGEARVPFLVPEGEALLERVPSVLEVIYLIFNEGYSAAAGQDWVRPELCHDAMRLGRVLAGLLPQHAEVHGLVALMELQASRLKARVDARGEPILLMDQNRARWDHWLIRHGLAALERAIELQKPLGAYTLQAAIAGCHARAATPEATDWLGIVALYDALVELTGSPIVELNRAVAVSMAFGPGQALGLVDELVEEGVLERYHLLQATRGDLLEKLGR
ncbi:MAG TPA: RNA polymerase sigma factor, partial [Polyangiaceae bacterium]|nr:RNA polymerase sigma factor [Polyangiaceae bacterium]